MVDVGILNRSSCESRMIGSAVLAPVGVCLGVGVLVLVGECLGAGVCGCVCVGVGVISSSNSSCSKLGMLYPVCWPSVSLSAFASNPPSMSNKLELLSVCGVFAAVLSVFLLLDLAGVEEGGALDLRLAMFVI